LLYSLQLDKHMALTDLLIIFILSLISLIIGTFIFGRSKIYTYSGGIIAIGLAITYFIPVLFEGILNTTLQSLIIGIILGCLILLLGILIKNEFNKPYKEVAKVVNKVVQTKDLRVEELEVYSITGKMAGLVTLNNELFKMLNTLFNKLDVNEKDLNRASNKATTNTDRFQKNISEIIVDMDQIHQSVIQISNQLEGVRERTNKFQNETFVRFSKLDFIVGKSDKLADQTNLIAVNAAIESAQAGETGEKFGIVADGIQRLSQRSRNTSIDMNKEVKAVTRTFRSEIQNIHHQIDNIEDLIIQIGELINKTSNYSLQQKQLIQELFIEINAIQDVSNNFNKLLLEYQF